MSSSSRLPAECLLLILAILLYVSHALAADETYKPCSSRSDCDASCLTIRNDGTSNFCGDDAVCFCFDDDECESSSDCATGHRCARLLPNASKAYCVPCNGGPPGLLPPGSIDESHSCPVAATVAASAMTPPPRVAEMFKKCDAETRCETFCQSVMNDGSVKLCDSNARNCFCFDDDECDTSADCPVLTMCAQFGRVGSSEPLRDDAKAFCAPCGRTPPGLGDMVPVDDAHVCGDKVAAGAQAATAPASDAAVTDSDSESATGSEFAADSDSDSTNGGGDREPELEPEADLGGETAVEAGTPSDVCVDARLLSHLPQTALVYRAHRAADVLCDRSGSCATPGHFVVFRGVAQTMRQYCARVRKDAGEDMRCVRRRMLVNSVRYSRGARVPARTAGLEFTALAARYETGVEHLALRLLVRAGL